MLCFTRSGMRASYPTFAINMALTKVKQKHQGTHIRGLRIHIAIIIVDCLTVAD